MTKLVAFEIHGLFQGKPYPIVGQSGAGSRKIMTQEIGLIGYEFHGDTFGLSSQFTSIKWHILKKTSKLCVDFISRYARFRKESGFWGVAKSARFIFHPSIKWHILRKNDKISGFRAMWTFSRQTLSNRWTIGRRSQENYDPRNWPYWVRVLWWYFWTQFTVHFHKMAYLEKGL